MRAPMDNHDEPEQAFARRPVGMDGKAAGAFRAGANLAPERAVGHRTWEDFLAERCSSASSLTS
jgi:hypothetical protein